MEYLVYKMKEVRMFVVYHHFEKLKLEEKDRLKIKIQIRNKRYFLA